MPNFRNGRSLNICFVLFLFFIGNISRGVTSSPLKMQDIIKNFKKLDPAEGHLHPDIYKTVKLLTLYFKRKYPEKQISVNSQVTG